MQAEITEHLGYEKNAPSNNKTGNTRNGSYQKQVKGEFGNFDITAPRDRDFSFQPVILPKEQSRFTASMTRLSPCMLAVWQLVTFRPTLKRNQHQDLTDAGFSGNKAVYLVIGVNLDGLKEVLGIWTAETEGSKFWLQVVTVRKNRGVKDIFIVCVDGLKEFLKRSRPSFQIRRFSSASFTCSTTV